MITRPSAEPPSTKLRCRSSTTATPRIPKSAPDAPTVGESGVKTSAPAEPASPEIR